MKSEDFDFQGFGQKLDGDLGYPDYPPYRDPFLTTYRSFGEDFSPTKVVITDPVVGKYSVSFSLGVPSRVSQNSTFVVEFLLFFLFKRNHKKKI